MELKVAAFTVVMVIRNHILSYCIVMVLLPTQPSVSPHPHMIGNESTFHVPMKICKIYWEGGMEGGRKGGREMILYFLSYKLYHLVLAMHLLRGREGRIVS